MIWYIWILCTLGLIFHFLATLPSLFFPNMVARFGQDNDLVVGIESYKPEYRKGLAKTVRPMDKVDKVGLSWEL